LTIRLLAYLSINRLDLAQKTFETMLKIEEDNCLVGLCQCWLTLHDPKAALNCYDALIQNLNELSDKFGYTLKTYNLLAIVLMNQGENEKAA
jgi:tetratricopeptide (TPR) repeat protein